MLRISLRSIEFTSKGGDVSNNLLLSRREINVELRKLILLVEIRMMKPGCALPFTSGPQSRSSTFQRVTELNFNQKT